MAKFKFDGQYLKDGSRVVANVKGYHIRKDRGSTVVANLKDDHIRDGRGSTVIANLKGEDIRKERGSTRIARMRDVDGDIDGPGRLVKAALWLYFVR